MHCFSRTLLATQSVLQCCLVLAGACSLVKTGGTATRRVGETLDAMGEEEGREGTFMGKLFNLSGGLYTKIGTAIEDMADKGQDPNQSKGELFVDANKKVVGAVVEETREFAGSAPQASTPKPGKADIQAVQKKLALAGLDPGPADGVCGPKTRQALCDFQKASKLAVTGEIDSPTLKALGVTLD